MRLPVLVVVGGTAHYGPGHHNLFCNWCWLDHGAGAHIGASANRPPCPIFRTAGLGCRQGLFCRRAAGRVVPTKTNPLTTIPRNLCMKAASLVLSCILTVITMASFASADDPKAGQQVAMKTTVMVKNGDKEEAVEL